MPLPRDRSSNDSPRSALNVYSIKTSSVSNSGKVKLVKALRRAKNSPKKNLPKKNSVDKNSVDKNSEDKNSVGKN